MFQVSFLIARSPTRATAEFPSDREITVNFTRSIYNYYGISIA